MTERYPVTYLPYPPLLAGWLVANLLGGAVGGVVEARFEFLGTLVLMGSAVGLAQWLLLRGRLPRAGYWAWVMALGWPLANLLWIAIGDRFAPLIQALTDHGWLWEVFWLNALRMPVILGSISILQALVLATRWRALPRWLLANLVGGAVMGAISATTCLVACAATTQIAGTLATGALLGALSWSGYALITGPMLLSLVRQSKI